MATEEMSEEQKKREAIQKAKKKIIQGIKNALVGTGIDSVAELQEAVPVASGFLQDNITFTVDGNSLYIIMPYYWKHVEYGRPPYVDPPSFKDIKGWCRDKGINLKFAYPIWKHVLEEGTRPQPFVRPFIRTKFAKIFFENLKRSIK